MREDRYEILERLGSGGAGAIYKGFDRQLKRHVAIKRLMNREEFADAAAEETALRKEAAALAALRHPNIVTVFDVSGDEEGVFIVMELLEGGDLAQWLLQERMALPDFIQLAEQLLEALVAAHSQSIMHRDIKPENIRVQRAPTGRLQVKLIDFGLARVSHVAMKQTVDQSGNILGSVFYMAPEQFVRKPLDGRTDLYALGCVLYEALAGRRAAQADSVAAVMNRHLKHDFTPLQEFRPDAPAGLCQWVESLLCLEKNNRPESAQVALESLRALLAGHPTSATPRSPSAAVPVAVAAPVNTTTRPQQPLPGGRPATSQVRPGRGTVHSPATPSRPVAPAPTPPGRTMSQRSAAMPTGPPPKRPLPWPGIITGGTLLMVVVSLWLSHLSSIGFFKSWEPLFTGQNLEGWNMPKNNWTVEDGAFRGKPGTRDRGSLDTVRKFKNFIVEFEFAVAHPSCNSGITLPNGCQPDIGSSGTGTVYMGTTGVPAPKRLTKIPDPKPHEWHTYRIQVLGTRITAHVDGALVADFEDPRAAKGPFEGPLRFECHEHIRVRSVRVKVL